MAQKNGKCFGGYKSILYFCTRKYIKESTIIQFRQTMKKQLLWMLAAILTCGIGMTSCKNNREVNSQETLSATDDASAFVNITDIVPDVILEIRYFGTYNFVGDRIDGYEEPTALLTRQASDSLKAVSDDVKAQGYRLIA